METHFKKQINETSTTSLAAEREAGLTPQEKKLLKDSMRRHDKALRMLADM
jgi:hypothetical protein